MTDSADHGGNTEPPDRRLDLKATLYEVVDRTAVITLNRPHRGNAWTGRLHAEYRQCLNTADRDPRIRVIVVTGSGDKFCVGGDVEALSGHAKRGGYDTGLASATAERSSDDIDESASPVVTPTSLAATASSVHAQFEPEFAYHFGISKPVVAAMNGAAAGIGLALACFADLRFAVPGAKLTTAHGKLALPPEYGLSWLLPRQIGLPRAMDVLLTSRVFTTDEAHAWGLVTELATPEHLLPKTLDFARSLATNVAAGSLAATRHMAYLDLHRGVGASVTESLSRLDTMMGSEDYRKGVSALSERRPPSF